MRRVAMAIAASIVVTACGGSDGVLETPSPTDPPPATAPPTTVAPTEAPAATSAPTTTTVPATTAPSTTTTTEAEAATTSMATTTLSVTSRFRIVLTNGVPDLPPVLGQAGDPHGSGCVPGGDVLPDGIWFGYAEAVSMGTITFDLGCYFSEPAASAAASEDGYGEVEDGFYIRNQNPRTFFLMIDEAAAVYWIDGDPAASRFPQPISLSAWPSPASWLPCPGESCALWVYVNEGAVTGIVEQYLP